MDFERHGSTGHSHQYTRYLPVLVLAFRAPASVVSVNAVHPADSIAIGLLQTSIQYAASLEDGVHFASKHLYGIVS